MFGNKSSVKALEWLHQYKRLRQKKLTQPLSDAEEKSLEDLERKLAKIADPAAPDDHRNRRQALRVHASLSAEFKSADDLKKAFIRNISGGGLYIETDHLLPVNTDLSLRLQLPPNQEMMEIPVTVVWTQTKTSRDLPKGMGLRFNELTPAQKEKIQTLIEENLSERIKGS